MLQIRDWTLHDLPGRGQALVYWTMLLGYLLVIISVLKTSQRPLEFHPLLDDISPVTLALVISLRQTSLVFCLIDNFTLNFAAITVVAMGSRLVIKKA